jgi:hypothetical protein
VHRGGKSRAVMDQDTSDVGRLWEDALDKYYKDTKTNIKHLPQMKWSVGDIMEEQQRQVESFNKYRHNKGLTDKFRSVVNKNSAVIQSVANNVANAASSVSLQDILCFRNKERRADLLCVGFPAECGNFDGVHACDAGRYSLFLNSGYYADQLQASQHVSDDYDQIAAFFDVMGSLMERLSLLETKLPSAKNYRIILMRVFTSLMGLCGTATYYVAEGRFSKSTKSQITK